MNTKFSLVVLVLFIFSLGIGSCTKEPLTNGDPIDDTLALADTSMLDVPYGTHPRQVYDVYLPANRSNTTPVVLLIHGGAWSAGNKTELAGYVNLVRTKWPEAAIVNMNYRLASNEEGIHHAEIMDDIHAAVLHIVAAADNYSISTNVAMLGVSAGAQLAMIYSYAYNSDIKCVGSIFGPTIINDYAWYSSVNLWLGGPVQDILSEYVGQPWDSTAYRAVSPYWQVSETSQPTILFHGSLDPIVPVYQSQWMSGKLNTLGVPHQYHEYFAFHSFDTNQNNDVVNKLVAFFQQHVD
jgi:acetyl esterase/lipase